MKKNLLLICSSLIILCSINSFAQVNDLARSQAELGKDGSFINEAASAGLMEVELGKLAQLKGSSQQVKDFGRMMERDHSDANRKLQAISSKMGLTPSTRMLDKHQDHLDRLKNKSGAEFDDDYMDLMVKDHDEDVEKFQKAQS
ncbi:MAG TPA: DUF4142 domain-containing protein, partial [Bacteroidales bacterium]|nr:DUF4142 domain-containing protein [Bacteroidales bacterium]